MCSVAIFDAIMARNKRQTLLIIILIIFTLNLIDGIKDSVVSGQWEPVLGQLLVLAGVGYIIYRSRGTIQRSREEYKRRFESTQDNLSMKDAALFSLAWSREIYQSIPDDRKQLVKQAFVLIGIGMLVVLLQVGFEHILTVLIIALLVLAGVNLLVWVFSTERGEKDRLHIELDTARQMQISLMPTEDPVVQNLDVSGICVPAQNVGGDHFDYVWLGGERTQFGVAVVDVAGKGMDAALTAVFTSGAFASEVQHETDVALILHKLNTAIRSRNNRSRFVSFLLVSIEPATRKLHFVNAGQSRPLLCRNGAVSTLENDGAHFPLGLVEQADYRTAAAVLEPGDTLLMYTDGLSEAMNTGKEVFGEERLRTLFAQLCTEGLPSVKIVSGLRDGVVRYSTGTEQHDDLTIVVVKVA
jgi:serine phosphatase RsbU (regulator of sigma subunit)